MNTLERYGSLGARGALALIFIISGFGKLTATAGAAAFIASKGLPAPTLLAVLAGVTELGGGLLVLGGLRVREAALLLAAFLVPTTVIFHNPSGLSGMAEEMQILQVLKNLAIIGGLLTVATRGATALSLDALLLRRRSTTHGEPHTSAAE